MEMNTEESNQDMNQDETNETTETKKGKAKKAKEPAEPYKEIKIVKFDVELELTQQMLGTIPKQQEIYKAYIGTKTPLPNDALEEAKDIKEIEEKGWTGFFKNETEGLYIMNYMILGFIKEAGNTLKAQAGIQNLRSKLENFLFVTPRHIPFLDQSGNIKFEADGNLERSLRAQTAQGPRISLARSEYVDAGTRLKFVLTLLPNKEFDETLVKTLFSYGQFKGLGQFRNGSYGQFNLKEFKKRKD